MSRISSNPIIETSFNKAFDIDNPDTVQDDIVSGSIDRAFDQSLPSKRRNPFGTFRAPDSIHDSAFDRFTRGVKQSLIPLLPLPGEVGGRIQEEAEFSAPATGTAGFLGNVTGSIIPNALMLVSPATAPVVLTNFVASSSGQKAEELLQNDQLSDIDVVAGAVGAGAIEGITELIGTKIIAKIGVKASKPIGKAILDRDFKQASKLVTALLQDAGVEGGEEVSALVLSNFSDVALGIITPEEALQNIKRDALITFAGGSLGGAALGVISLATPAARLEFRAAFDERQNIIQDVSAMTAPEKNALFTSVNQILHQSEIQNDSGIESKTSPPVTPEQAENAEFVRSVLANEPEVIQERQAQRPKPVEIPEGEKQEPLLLSDGQRDFEPTVASMNDEIVNNLRRRRILPSGKLSSPPKDSALKLIYGLEEGASIDTMAEVLGGSDDSVTWHTLFGEIKKGRDSSLDSYYKINDEWHQAIKDAGVKLGSKRMQAMSPALASLDIFQTIANREKTSKAITQTIQLSGNQSVKMHPSQLMFLAASLQDKQTRDLVVSNATPVVIEGQPSGSEFFLTKEDVDTINRSLDPDQRAIVNEFVRIINGPLRDIYVEYSERQFGENRAREDTYIPRHRSGDEIKAIRAESSEQSQQLAMDRVKINKKRTEDTTKPIEIRDLFLEFANLNWTINQLRFVSPTVQSARRVLADPSISRTIRESTRGTRALKRFTDHYDEIEAGVVGRTIQPRMSADSAFGRLARNVSKGVLGFSPTVPFYQPVSLINASFEMDKRFLMRAWLEQAQFNPAVDKRMKQVGAIRFRSEGSTYSLINEGAAIGQQPQSLLGVKAKNELAFSAIRFFDGMAVRTIWRGAELQSESEFKRGIIKEDQLFNRAKQIATNVINRTQPTSDPLYVSGLALQRRSRGGVAALLTMFRGQTSKTVDMIHREIARMSQSPTRRFQSAANIFILTFGIGFILAIIREIIKATLRGFSRDFEEEENLIQRLALDTAQRAAGVAVLGEWIFAVTRPLTELTTSELLGIDDPFGSGNLFDPDFSPVTGMMEDMVRKSAQLASKIENDAQAEEILDVATDVAAMVAALNGVPLVAPVREAKKIYKQVAD